MRYNKTYTVIMRNRSYCSIKLKQVAQLGVNAYVAGNVEFHINFILVVPNRYGGVNLVTLLHDSLMT